MEDLSKILNNNMTFKINIIKRRRVKEILEDIREEEKGLEIVLKVLNQYNPEDRELAKAIISNINNPIRRQIIILELRKMLKSRVITIKIKIIISQLIQNNLKFRRSITKDLNNLINKVIKIRQINLSLTYNNQRPRKAIINIILGQGNNLFSEVYFNNLTKRYNLYIIILDSELGGTKYNTNLLFTPGDYLVIKGNLINLISLRKGKSLLILKVFNIIFIRVNLSLIYILGLKFLSLY